MADSPPDGDGTEWVNPSRCKSARHTLRRYSRSCTRRSGTRRRPSRASHRVAARRMSIRWSGPRPVGKHRSRSRYLQCTSIPPVTEPHRFPLGKRSADHTRRCMYRARLPSEQEHKPGWWSRNTVLWGRRRFGTTVRRRHPRSARVLRDAAGPPCAEVGRPDRRLTAVPSPATARTPGTAPAPGSAQPTPSR